MRLIDAEVAYDLHVYYPMFARSRADLSDLRELLKEAPTLTLDDLRSKGRWKPLHTEGCCNPYDDLLFEWECSVCGDRFADEEDYMPYKFCPNCGADMRGEWDG